jgi:Sulfotransferase family
MQTRLLELEHLLDLRLIDWRLDGRAGASAVITARSWSDAAWALAAVAGPLELDAEDVARGLALARRPVFICGVHRSGTTLVRDLLDWHPQLSVLPAEGLFFTNLQRRIVGLEGERALELVGRTWLQRLADHSSQPPFWLLGRSSVENSPYVSFARALMAWWRVAERAMSGSVKSWPLVSAMLAYAFSMAGGRIADGQLRWAEKTPTNERFIDRLLADFPECKIIHVIRDPISVYESRKSMDVQTFGTFGNRRSVLKDLARTYRVALAHRHTSLDGRYLLVRYEDLIDRQQTEIDRLAAFLRIQSLPILWRPTVAGIPVASNSSFEAATPTGRILTMQEHAPKHNLDRADQDLVGSVVGRLANHFGYDIARVGGWKARLTSLYYSL